MPDSVVTSPVVGKARTDTIDKLTDDLQTGKPVTPGAKRHPAASRPQTPERNDTYSEMEQRIYGDKSAKAKR